MIYHFILNPNSAKGRSSHKNIESHIKEACRKRKRAYDAQKNADIGLVRGQCAAAEEHSARQGQDHRSDILPIAAKTEEQHAKAHGKQREKILQGNANAGGDIPVGFVEKNQRSHIEQSADRELPGKALGISDLFELGYSKGQQNNGGHYKFDK